MKIGASIFLIAVGAILKFAVTATVVGINIQTVGVILIIAGAVGLLIGLFLIANGRRDVVETRVYDETRPPPPPPAAY